MDVKTAFLNEDLNEEVYMEQSEGFVLLGNENKVCKLVKSLYGLKQAPKQWHENFDHAILSDGFRHNNVDKCLYSKTCDDYMVIVCLYVDDMLILSDDMKGITETKRFLSLTFKMKDFGEVDTILGIKVKRNSGGYALNQTHYIEKLVSKFSHLKIKDANTPFDSSIKLEKNDGRLVAQLEYANAIGSLMYAAQCTRVAISFAVSKLSRFISNPSVEHWKAIGRVLGYLKNTKELSLQYSKFPAILEGYSDASWISSVGDNLSTTGWVFTLGGGAISWGSKKQTCISHSTMEAEFIALAATGKEAEWLRDLMMDIPFTANNVSTVSIHYDSQATLAHAYSGVYNGKSIHISIRHEVKLKAFNEIQSMCDKHLKGTWRVGGVLAISRAFGDKLLKAYVVANPKIQEEEIDGVDFIIIASDGLWNVVSNKEVVMEIEVLGLPMMTRDMGLSWSPSPSLLMEDLIPLMPITLIAHTHIEPTHLAASILTQLKLN
ncbi:Retrovirus-related Pol polyprotein from transposon TNT 1-94 [Vitis vinifera]|uniref:Retrovirus-related Pol polyprotein from transposon TNT 1-94 n=1 Tax=Vitis vinifera TaxID=29760 RepID=A0A438G6I4_VITVI|nr:Retrovirus-related Pol polyprotein from transposon TNT 1-94 [Vitis vinifera]